MSVLVHDRRARGRGPPRAARVLCAAAVAAGALACAGGSPHGDELARRHPGLAAAGPHRLGDAHPYVMPLAGRVTLFHCRWSLDAPIPVAVAADATPEERRVLEAALGAWEGAGLGVRFVALTGGDAPIRIDLEDGPVQTPVGPDTGNAVVDCRVGEPGGQSARGAELVSAHVRLARRTAPDVRGRDRALAPEELAGAALHELGHALGFAGHARRGDTVMLREVDAVRRAGRRLLAGEPFRDANLSALYALPSGAVVATREVEAWRTDLVDRMARLAAEHGLEGPFARVGETAARVFWRDARGREYGLWVVNLQEALGDPGRAVVVPEPRVRRALPRSRDLRPGG